MKFNKENYEIYVLDFLEGKLTEEDHAMFIKFLEDHPDIYKEVKDISNLQLQPGDIKFYGKNILKRATGTFQYNKDFENFCIAFIEGDLEPDEKLKFENWLKENNEKKYEFESYRKVYLKADKNIFFSPKSKLKKLTIVQRRIRWVSILSAAAAVTVFLIIFTKSADIINRKFISEKSDDELKITTEIETLKEKTEQINKDSGQFQELESTEKQLTEAKLDHIKIEEQAVLSEQKYTSAENYPGHTYDKINTGMEPGAWRKEKISIKPVSSILAFIEIHNSVDYNELKQPVPEKGRNLDGYQTIREFASENILANLFSVNESDEQTKLTLWNLASNGFEGLNNISEGGYALNREINENGTTKRISVETPLLGLSIPIKNKHPQ